MKIKGDRDNWINWLARIMVECKRVMKPGAHGLVWSLPRTNHWTATALEDAGFEIRDVVSHIFGTGFPKSLDISKAIDKQAGIEREVIGKKENYHSEGKRSGTGLNHYGKQDGSFSNPELASSITAPATEAAKQWAGWGTALKPTAEFWILVRKPLQEKTVASNVLKHGCGGINIDACRIAGSVPSVPMPAGGTGNIYGFKNGIGRNGEMSSPHEQGRFPANLVLSHNEDCECVGMKKVKGTCTGNGDAPIDDGTETVETWNCTDGCAVKMLDKQSGELKSGTGAVKRTSGKGNQGNCYAKENRPIGTPNIEYGDTGGASRFFYCAKTSPSERRTGLTDSQNTHPTVKPLKLMKYLIKLITPPKGVVLDCFMGSGSTGIAAREEFFDFIGIEKEPEYFAIAAKRIENIKVENRLFE